MTAFAHTQQRCSLLPTWKDTPHATSFQTTTVPSTRIECGPNLTQALHGFG